MENKVFDFFWLINILKKYFRLLCVILSATLIISSISSLLIDNKFESSVVVYPTITNAATTSLETALEFGGEGEAEQLLEVLTRKAIRDSIIKKFNLFIRYEIDSTDLYPKTSINKLYKEHISFKKTKFNSVKITVLDKDPHFAADIANEYLVLVDSAMTNIREDRATQTIEILERRKELLTNQKNIAQDSLQKYHSLGIIKIASQTERLTEQYAIALAANNIAGANRIKKELNMFAENVGPMEEILRKTWKIEEELSEISLAVDQIRLDAEYTANNLFVINRAVPADKKSYPIRWLIVFSSLISVFTIAIVLLIIIESEMLKKNGN